tara:strand:- start:5765 stop:8935 length:3171 start_codon:yes stop_codon:yes gene_type:complete
MKKLLFIFLSTALTSFQAQSYKFNSNVNEFEESATVYSSNSFNTISNNSVLIDIDFGTVADFMLFTGVGAVANTGVSTITGNVGSNAGAIAGFGAPSVLNGVIENSNAVTSQAYADLEIACLQLQGLTTTIADHSGIFGSAEGETIYPGVYAIASAVAITGTLTLDAQGDPDAIFIFKITGALNSVAGATVLLANDASSANVFWIAVGAVGLGANTTMIGTAIAYPGAVSLGAGGSISGRLYATVGAIATNSFEAAIPVAPPAYNYLGAYTADGTPLYLEDPSDVVSAATQETISNSLPDDYSVPEYNPQYITSNYDTNLKIEGSTDILVTYVSEGVDAKNALGFYTYDINNPSATTPTKDDITIVFPNVSGVSSGGSLQVGDKVNIGSFSAGTGIGWVLIADGWNSTDGEVGDSAWELYSNPDYNPETDASLRLHNVLLEDTVNERIILGFEDVLRDDNSCDNDFNDAIFYITASAYQEINTNNFADITSAYDVSSGNEGGLESNGSLAKLIAKRNFKRKKEGNPLKYAENQQEFIKSNLKKKVFGASLMDYLPDSGMYRTETASVSSPDDLIGLTNADEVFSVDYYQDSTRVSAVLATSTTGKIYDHSKVICDRLNSASLEDVRTVIVRGHQIISSKIKQAKGEVEYTLSFSIKLGSAVNELFSFWNIDQYPMGDYQNFQIWGSSFSQVFSIANYIIDKHTEKNGLISTIVKNVIPNVFVKSGEYLNGFINLNIINKTNETSIDFSGSFAETEVSDRTFINNSYALSGQYNDTLSIETGIIFDIGFSLQKNSSAQKDALYLADGPWGLDYLDEYATVNFFDITSSDRMYSDEIYEVDRNAIISGEVKGNINLFRHILPGNQTLDIADYNFINFLITNNEPVELIIMQEEDRDWENRIRYTIPTNDIEKTVYIPFSDFVDGSGNTVQIKNIKTVVYSIIGDYSNTIAFAMSINNLSFSKQGVLGVSDVNIGKSKKLINYPNPFEYSTTISLLEASNSVIIQVFDLLGRQVDFKNISTGFASKKIYYTSPNLSRGIYKYRLKDDYNKLFFGSFLIK